MVARDVRCRCVVKLSSLALACSFLAACGGGSTPRPAAPAPPPDEEDEPVVASEDDRVAEVEELPPPPRTWRAEATLAPVSGVKLEPAAVAFTLTEGDGGARVAAELVGLKAGTYHLVVHDGAACGKNAKQAGRIWADAAGAAVSVQVARGTPGTIDSSDLPLMLDGESTIVGRTLVLHADKRGKPGKAVACGEITSAEAGGE